MIIKEADGHAHDIEVLQGLLAHPEASPEIRQRIEREIRNIRSGAKGEAEIAYELNFGMGATRNWAVIHDLRLVYKGRVAQIDHLIIGRFLHGWVCESKRFSEGLGINAQGECSMFWNGRPQGIPSPYAQNQKHIAVLEHLCNDNVVPLPIRMGFRINPVFHGLVVVSKNARISRPESKGWWTEGIVKADALIEQVDKGFEELSTPLAMARVIGQDTLEALARSIVELHTPISFDWHGKFGLAKPGEAQADITPRCLPPEPEVAPAKSKLECGDCGVVVSYNVAKFCWSNPRRFGGQAYCMSCQKSH